MRSDSVKADSGIMIGSQSRVDMRSSTFGVTSLLYYYYYHYYYYYMHICTVAPNEVPDPPGPF